MVERNGPIEILLVEDNPGDVRLTKEALKEGKVYSNLHTCKDGVEAMEFLRRQGKFKDAPRPDIILLDLNLPRKDGREVLAEVKEDADLRTIPVVVLTTSEAEEDIARSYDLHAKDVYEGTGIGLSLCKKIVEFHGGRIWIEQPDGEGTSIRWTLPAADDPTT